MKITEVAFVGYPVTDLDRARAFYEGALGLTKARGFEDEKGAWFEYDIGSTTLAISNVAPDWQPRDNGPCIALEVEDLDDALAYLQKQNVTITLSPVASPVCRFFCIADPDQNQLMIHQRTSSQL